VELDALAQMERVRLAIARGRPAVRQHRPDRGIIAERDQALDDMRHHTIGVGVTVGAGIGGADIGVEPRAQQGLGAGTHRHRR